MHLFCDTSKMDYEGITIAGIKDFTRENGLRDCSRLRRAELITYLRNKY